MMDTEFVYLHLVRVVLRHRHHRQIGWELGAFIDHAEDLNHRDVIFRAACHHTGKVGWLRQFPRVFLRRDGHPPIG